MKIIPITFEVTGSTSFPIDMLRYDGVIPATEADAARIERTFESVSNVLFKISVTKPDGYKHWVPTASRWSTFGWTVNMDRWV